MFELGAKHVSGPVCVRSACRSFSRSFLSARIQTIVSSRKFRLRGWVVVGVLCMSFASGMARTGERLPRWPNRGMMTKVLVRGLDLTHPIVRTI
jgi:hypothetical protein